MSRLTLVLAAILVALLLVVNHLFQRLDVAAADARTAAHAIRGLEGQAGAQSEAIKTLNRALDEERLAQKKLQEDRATKQALLSSREHKIKELKSENEQLKAWADQPLPDDVRRLRERPALVGAGAYRDWLSGGDPVRAAGEPPAQ